MGLFLRIISFAITWWACLWLFVYAEWHFGDDNGAAYMLVLSAVQFPLTLIIYLVFDYLFKGRALFKHKEWRLVPAGIALSVILYIPLMVLIITLPKILF